MRDAVIVISDLYVRAKAQPQTLRLPGLESIARFGTRKVLEGDWRAWVARWLGRGDLAALPAASVAAAALDPAPAADETVWMATPVQLVAGISSVHLGEILALDPSVARTLAQDFNTTFSDTAYRLEVVARDALLMRGPPADVETFEPARFVGADAASVLPRGANVAPLLRLASEIEMWLHSHPVNAARAQRFEAPVGTLWLWGGGAGRAMSAKVHDEAGARACRAFGSDAWLHGLQHLNGGTIRELPERFDEQLAQSGERALFVIEAARLGAGGAWDQALARIDRDWLARARELVDRGLVRRLTVLANDREWRYERRARLKVWRRPRAGLAALA